MKCTLCGCTVADDDATHLCLYVNGSEGIWVCLSCRMALTYCARGIQSASTRAHKRGYMLARRPRHDPVTTPARVVMEEER
jgi:hypothetical protein